MSSKVCWAATLLLALALTPAGCWLDDPIVEGGYTPGTEDQGGSGNADVAPTDASIPPAGRDGGRVPPRADVGLIDDVSTPADVGLVDDVSTTVDCGPCYDGGADPPVASDAWADAGPLDVWLGYDGGEDDAMAGILCGSNGDCPAGQECRQIDYEGQNHCGPPECGCLAAGDFCNSNGKCVVAAVNCLLAPCPDGYACGEEGQCVCQDAAICLGGCSKDAHCKYNEMCIDGACLAAYCASDDACPPGRVCGAESFGQVCVEVQGEQATGETCSQSESCLGGYCLGGLVCVQRCAANSDCAAGEECAVPYLGMPAIDYFVPYCQAPHCGACAASEYCDIDGECATGPSPTDGECTIYGTCGDTGESQ